MEERGELVLQAFGRNSGTGHTWAPLSLLIVLNPAVMDDYFVAAVSSGASLLNFWASASLARASSPRSLPTATTVQPSASQWWASASTEVRIPGALPVLRMRRTASVIVACTSG